MERALQLCCVPVLLAGCVSGGFRAPDGVSDPAVGSFDPAPLAEHGPSPPRAEIGNLLEKPALDLDDLLRIAELANPELAMARHALGAAAGEAWQAALYPNPVLELEAEDVPVDHLGTSRSQNTVSITQPVVIGGRLAVATSAARAEQEALRLTLELKRREVLAAVRAGYVEVVYLKRAIRLYGELLEVARRTFEIAKARLDARAAPEAEVIKAEIEALELELGRGRLERRLLAATERLRASLGDIAIGPARIADELPGRVERVELDRLRALITERHPALLRARKRADAAQHRVEQAEAERYPDVGVRLAYGRNTAEDEDLVEAGLSIALPIFDRNQGRIVEAKHRAGRALREADLTAARLFADLSAAHAGYLTASDELATFGDRIVPAASTAISQARDGYQAGRVALLDLLDAQRTLGRARLSRLQSLRDAHLARARLWGLVGPGLDEANQEGDRP